MRFNGFWARQGRKGGQEEGVVLIWLTLFLPILITVVIYSVNISMQVLRYAQLQQLTDAAVFAANLQLDMTRDGYLRSKRAAYSVFKNSSIAGVGDLSAITLNKSEPLDSLGAPIADPWEPAYGGNDFLHNVAEFSLPGGQEVRVVFERGTYWADFATGAQASRTFESREPIGFNPGPGGDTISYATLGQPTYAMVNAARVRTSVSSPYLFGVGDMFDSNLVSLSIIDDGTISDVAPFAIPVCELLLESENEEGDDFVAEEYIPDNVCGRDVTVTEANYAANQNRYDGIVRYHSHVARRSRTYNHGPGGDQTYYDDNAPSIRGVFGIPKQKGLDVISATDLVDFFAYKINGTNNQDWSDQAVIGQRFAPLDTPNLGSGILFDETPQNNTHVFRNLLRNWITNPNFSPWGDNNSFQNVFGSISPNLAPNTIEGFPDPGSAAPLSTTRGNYPFLKRFRPDLPDLPDAAASVHWHKMINMALVTPGTQPGRIPALFTFPLGNLRPSTGNPFDPTTAWSDQLFQRNILGQAIYTNLFNEERNDPSDPDLALWKVVNPPQNTWFNPMCHDRLMQRNNPNQNVRTVRVLLIAPQDSDGDGHPEAGEYCDYDDLFNPPHDPNRVTPASATQPRIVGWVPLAIHAFNISNLQAEYPAPNPAPGARNYVDPPGDFSPVLTPFYHGPGGSPPPPQPWPVDPRFRDTEPGATFDAMVYHWFDPNQFPPLTNKFDAFCFDPLFGQSGPYPPILGYPIVNPPCTACTTQACWDNITPGDCPGVTETIDDAQLYDPNDPDTTITTEMFNRFNSTEGICMLSRYSDWDQDPAGVGLETLPPGFVGQNMNIYEDSSYIPLGWPMHVAEAFPHQHVMKHPLPAMTTTPCAGPYTDNSCYEVRNRNSGYGCGGLRARLGCTGAGGSTPDIELGAPLASSSKSVSGFRRRLVDPY